MDVKTLTMSMTIALIATMALPGAAAHWRGDYVVGGTTVKTTAVNWYFPHEHTFALHSGNAPSVYSGNFQRMCLDTSTLPFPSLTWGTQNGCDVPIQGGVFPPVRGMGLGLTNCFDIDSIFETPILNLDARTGFGVPSSIVLDWGVGRLGPAFGPGFSQYNFADHFAHPNAAAGAPPTGPNPTGATPAILTSGLPTHVVTVPGVVQADITYTGLGWDGSGTSHTEFPGVDVGDNDAEACTGGASHTYAINSGTFLNTANAGPVNGAGAGLNDFRNIGGDLTFDVTPGIGTGIAGSSEVVHTGGTVPATAAGTSDGLPVGALLQITEISGSKAIPYSVCNALVDQGCTNIPQQNSGLRFGNALGDDAVYSSLQDCVWHAAQTDRPTPRPYSGVQALWGTATPAGAGDGTCWPERLVRSSPLPTSIYLPSSLTPVAAWNPDQLPATYRHVEAITIFVDEATMKNFDGFNSGCAQYTAVDPTAACFAPTFGAPNTWFDAPNTLTGFSAIFQP